MTRRNAYICLAAVSFLTATPVLAQQDEQSNTDPAPSGREETETTVYPDGISISMPGKDAETPSTNPVDWSGWEAGHDDDTTVVFEPSTEPDPPAEPDPEPEQTLDSSS